MAIELENYPALRNDANLVAYWRMEGNSNDSKGSNNGTDTAITYGASYGKFGQGAQFVTANSSKILVGTGTNLQLTGNFTVNFWINANSITPTNRIMGKWSATDYGWFINTNATTGYPNLVTTTDGALGTISDVSATSAITAGSWVMVTITRSGSTANFYINGSLVNSPSTNGSTFASGQNCAIGCLPDGGYSQFFGGNLDDIAIFSRALSTTEISDFYNATSFIPQAIIF